MSEGINHEIRYCSFSQDQKYFLIGTKEGCRIYRTFPFAFGFKLGIEGTFSMVKMFNSSSMFVIVGSLSDKYLTNQEVLVWDDKIKKKIYKFLIKKEVIKLKLTSEKIIIACEKLIYIFNAKSFQLIDIIETGKNEEKLIAVSYKERDILVYPSKESKNRKLTIKNYKTSNYLYLNPITDGKISHICLSFDGKFLATVINENKIEIYLTEKGENLDQLDRKEEKGDKITSISFSGKRNYFLMSFSKGIIPIWSMKKAKEAVGEIDENSKASNIHGMTISYIPILSSILPQSTNEQAFNKAQLNDYGKPNYKAVKLGNEEGDKKYLYIITSNGKYFLIEFKDKGEKILNNKGDFEIKQRKDLFENN